MSRCAMAVCLLGVMLLAVAGPALAGAQVTIMAYYPVYASGDTLAHRSLVGATSVNAVGAFLYSIDGQGVVRGQPEQDLMALARQRGIKVYALVHNSATGGFSRWTATQILTNPTVRARALDSMAGIVQTGGYDGIHVDLENVNPSERAHLTGFLRELAARLRPLGYEVGIAVPAKTADDPYHGWSGAFDYRALGQICDHIAVMAYDEHYMGGTPGPIASLGWVAQVARYSSSVIPPHKVLLGIATYGYDWPAYGTGAKALSSPGAVSLAAQVGATVQWDSRAGVPFFRYWTAGGQARIVYYESSASTELKIQLVSGLGLGGVAVWRLGTEDPGIWPLMQSLKDSYAVEAQPGAGGAETPVDRPVYHVVQPGETLFVLAQRYGVPMDSIARANSLANPDMLMVGQRLLIQASIPQQTQIHIVQPGDTLWLIAARYGTTWQAIAHVNNLAGTWIYPGQRLVISGNLPAPQRVHVVAPGESLWLIAGRYGTTWQAISRANNLGTTVIYPGQRLIIP